MTKAFCEANGLRMVVRSHQWEREGFRFMHGGRLLTVFSARDYDQSSNPDGLAHNHGAVVLFIVWNAQTVTSAW